MKKKWLAAVLADRIRREETQLYRHIPGATPPAEVDAMLAGLQANGWVAPGSIVVVERGVGAPELNWPAGWTPWPVRGYGDTRVESAEVTGPAC